MSASPFDITAELSEEDLALAVADEIARRKEVSPTVVPVSYTHLRAHET